MGNQSVRYFGEKWEKRELSPQLACPRALWNIPEAQSEQLEEALNAEKRPAKQAEQALALSERNYRLIVEHQNELVVKVDAEGRFLYVSPSYCAMFGKSEAELLGRSFHRNLAALGSSANLRACKNTTHYY